MTAEERKKAIVEAAIPLFAERGDSVTTREIAEASGVSEALLYRHFPGKKDIFDAIESNCVAMASEPVERLKRLPDNTATLVVCIYALLWKLQKGPAAKRAHKNNLCQMVTRSLLSDGEFASQFIHRTSDIWIEKMERCLASAIESGDVVISGDDAKLGVWMGHHFSVMVSLMNLPGSTVVEYPGGSDRLLERTALFCLRGIGMTAEAIDAHFHPEQLALLLPE